VRSRSRCARPEAAGAASGGPRSSSRTCSRSHGAARSWCTGRGSRSGWVASRERHVDRPHERRRDPAGGQCVLGAEGRAPGRERVRARGELGCLRHGLRVWKRLRHRSATRLPQAVCVGMPVWSFILRQPMIHPIIEPFRIKAVEPIRISTRGERIGWLEEAKLNVFQLPADRVLLDFLTDSGTGAMSAKQWGAIMEGDESYAGSRFFFRLEAVLKDLTGYQHIIPTHQGRAAEHILFSVATKRGDLVPNNTHFDTTRANLEYQGAEAIDLVIPEGLQPRTYHPFKGNIDLARVADLLEREAHRIPFGMMTLTNNSGGGQPVSLANLRAYRELLNRYGKPLILDVCRYAENSMFIKLREEGQQDRTVKSIAQEMFSLADGCTMSAKKDGMVNIGGFLALNLGTSVEAAKTLL